MLMAYYSNPEPLPMHCKLFNCSSTEGIGRSKNYIYSVGSIHFCHFCNRSSFSNSVYTKNHPYICFVFLRFEGNSLYALQKQLL